MALFPVAKLSLADLGDWSGHRIGDHDVVKAASEHALDAAARLHAFASSRPSQYLDLTTSRQDELAASDLIIFAIHARRFVENTLKPARIRPVRVSVVQAGRIQQVPFTRVLNTIVHNVRISAERWDRDELHRLAAGQEPTRFALAPGLRMIPAAVMVESDHGDKIMASIEHLMAVFENQVAEPAMELCAREKLFLRC